jgi:hypothetical protein
MPYIVTTKGDIRVTTPNGTTITIPEGSTFRVNRHETRFDSRTVVLDNARIFGDGFE